MVDGRVATQSRCWAAGSQRRRSKEKKNLLQIRINTQRLAAAAVVANGWWLSTWAEPMMVDVAVDEDGGVRVVAAATGKPGVPTRAHLYPLCSVTVD